MQHNTHFCSSFTGLWITGLGKQKCVFYSKLSIPIKKQGVAPQLDQTLIFMRNSMISFPAYEYFEMCLQAPNCIEILQNLQEIGIWDIPAPVVFMSLKEPLTHSTDMSYMQALSCKARAQQRADGLPFSLVFLNNRDRSQSRMLKSQAQPSQREWTGGVSPHGPTRSLVLSLRGRHQKWKHALRCSCLRIQHSFSN